MDTINQIVNWTLGIFPEGATGNGIIAFLCYLGMSILILKRDGVVLGAVFGMVFGNVVSHWVYFGLRDIVLIAVLGLFFFCIQVGMLFFIIMMDGEEDRV
ncbi:MAG: hypothetical protein HZC02_02065 [Candidatus Levybacteria bacterium]|nr:hypothetical protein [Candidatus Levybacteria bacterium]